MPDVRKNVPTTETPEVKLCQQCGLPLCPFPHCGICHECEDERDLQIALVKLLGIQERKMH